eukprot:3684284-Rhodomonas_salina.1
MSGTVGNTIAGLSFSKGMRDGNVCLNLEPKDALHRGAWLLQQRSKSRTLAILGTFFVQHSASPFLPPLSSAYSTMHEGALFGNSLYQVQLISQERITLPEYWVPGTIVTGYLWYGLKLTDLCTIPKLTNLCTISKLTDLCTSAPPGPRAATLGRTPGAISCGYMYQ